MSNTEVKSRFGRRVAAWAVVLIGVGLTSSAWGGAVATAELDDGLLSFDQRVDCQHRIEEVYWRHRIWPAENPGPKPPLAEVLPAATLRQRVATQLEKSAALDIFWSRPLTGEQLQAEVHRMVRDTKNPALLRELFAALDNDPFLVAECLARPVLTERLTRNWYARDARIHGALREQAEAALEAHAIGATRMQDLGGKYVETEWRLVAESAEHSVVELNADGWLEHVEHLMTLFDTDRDPGEDLDPSAAALKLPVGKLSRLVENDDRFSITSVLSVDPERLRTATVSWTKRPFEAWWVEQGRASVESAGRIEQVVPPPGGYESALPFDDGCTMDTWTAMKPVAPSRRRDHTAVWTGTEMIVWGGYLGGEFLNTGGRYDPATDSWTPTAADGDAPTERTDHTAVWTGTEMIVWGGNYSLGTRNTGGRYDPATDSWTATSTGTGVPTKRELHTAVWTGTEMIVWGGTGNGERLKTGGRYDPLTDSWVPTSTLAGTLEGREQHTAVWTGTEMIVWGGWGSSGDILSTGVRYDPATDGWTPTSTGSGVPTERLWHTAIWTGTEMIVWGGYEAFFFGHMKTGGRYDPATDSWTATSAAPGAPRERSDHTAVWTGTEMIVWGGWGFDEEVYDSGGRYDPATDSWTATSRGAGVPTARHWHSAVWTGTEMIVWGGGGFYVATGGRYDPATDSWTPTSTETGVPTARDLHTALWTGAEMIVWGGYSSTFFNQNTGGRYDPATDSWTPTSTEAGVPTARRGHTAVWTGTEMIVWGGATTSGGRYAPTTDSWTPTSTGSGVPSGTRDHSAIWTGTEMIAWGGSTSGGAVTSTGGRYDPADDSWTETSTAFPAPTARERHTAVWTGTEMIVWGGIDGSNDLLNTGRLYDPATDSWTWTSTGSGLPAERSSHTAVWTGAEMIVWGGVDVSELHDTGGRYNPRSDNWTATSTGAGVPTGRYEHTAVWTGEEMIVWGGAGGGEQDTGGRYDPASDAWTATSTGSGVPTPRRVHTAVWTGEEMIVWGGHASGILYEDTGALYCACEGGAVSTWYPDADADGYGAESTGIPSCSQPPGYVAVAGDCDDAWLHTYPGAAEVNDGLDNQCPGDAGYGLVDEISGGIGFHDPDDENELSWTPQAGAIRYEIARSANGQFVTDCETWQTEETLWIDTDPLPAGGLYHYLVRAAVPNPGSWGQGSDGVERTWVCP